MTGVAASSRVSLVCTTNDEEVLAQCLMRSPDVASGRLPLLLIRDATGMAEAYNRALDIVTTRIVVFAHQDVYLPQGWLDLALARLDELETSAPHWMVAGCYGVRSDGRHAGLVLDVCMDRELGERGFGREAVVSLDELLLVLKREPGFRFDENLPHFHLYGTDLVQTCLAMGRSAWALEMPVVHNNQPIPSLAGGYAQAYRYAVQKWRRKLPIPMPVCRLSTNPVHLWRARWRRRNAPPRTGVLVDAAEASRDAGYDDYPAGRA